MKFLKKSLKKIDVNISNSTLDSNTKKNVFYFSQKKFNSILSEHNIIDDCSRYTVVYNYTYFNRIGLFFLFVFLYT